MIYFYYGNDLEKLTKARESLAVRLLGEQTGSLKAKSSFNDIDWDQEKFENLYKTISMFSDSELIICNNVLDNKEAKEFIMSKLKQLKESANVFLFTEKKALKDIINKLNKYAEEVKEFSVTKNKEIKDDIFAITKPLELRDKKGMWLEFQKIRETMEPEQLNGMLFWKVKSMILSGQNPKWNESELKKLSSKLVSLHHNAHRGLIDFKTGLERLILEVL
jgi:hypothetical protein